MFKEISIFGRIAYSAYCLEMYIKSRGYDTEKWNIVFDVLWAFDQFEFADEYMYCVMEYLPEYIFECDSYSESDEWDYMHEDTFEQLRELYGNCKKEDIKVVNYTIQSINYILSNTVYTSNRPPEKCSLEKVNEIYNYFTDKLKEMPSIEPFKIYSISDKMCWGIEHSRSEVNL